MGIVVAFGSVGLFLYQTDGNDSPSWASRPLDLPRLATDSPLVAEGTVTQRDFRTVELQRPSGKSSRVYAVYKIEVLRLWRGEEVGIISVAVPDFSAVNLIPDRSYLLFFAGRADQEKFPGHWSLVDPHQVWGVNGSNFETYPGITPVRSLTDKGLTDILAAHPTR